MTLAFDPSQQRTIQEVREWYHFLAEFLGRERARIAEDLRTGGVPSDPRFLGKTREEVDRAFDFYRDELDFMAMLDLLAAAEARIQCDFRQRVEKLLKDPVSRAFRAIENKLRRRKTTERARLEEDILDTWVDHATATKGPVGSFKGALNLRHWLAHGRYWKPRMGRPYYSPGDVYYISETLLQAIQPIA